MSLPASPRWRSLSAGNAYAKLEELGAALENGMKSAAQAAGVAVQFNRIRFDVLRIFHRRASA